MEGWRIFNFILAVIGIPIAIACLVVGGAGGIFWGAVFGLSGIGCVFNVISSSKTIDEIHVLEDELKNKEVKFEEGKRILKRYIDIGIADYDEIENIEERNNVINLCDYLNDYQQKTDKVIAYKRNGSINTIAAIAGGVALGAAMSKKISNSDKEN